MKNKIFRALSLSLVAALSVVLLAGCGGSTSSEGTTSSDKGSSTTEGTTSSDKGSSTTETLDFPTKPITVIVPYTAGGSSDVMARVFEGIAPNYLNGQSLVVENIVGSGGTIGMTDYLANYKADGYTLIFPSSAPLVSQPLMKSLAYDPIEDFQLVAGVSSNSLVLVVPGNSPINTLDDLIATYKDAPGTMLYGYPAVASNPHLAQEILYKELGLTGTGVPLGASADVVTAVLGNHVDVAACSEQEALELSKAGDLKVLGSFSETPLETVGFEDVQTFTEMGYTATFANWRAMLGNKDIPEAELAYLREAFHAMLQDQVVVDFLNSIGDVSYIDMDHDDYVAKVKDEQTAYDALFQELKIGKYE